MNPNNDNPELNPQPAQKPHPKTLGLKPWHFIAALLTILVATTALYLAVAPADPKDPTQPRESTNEQQSTNAPQPILTEFGDFQCPHCARFARQIYPQLKRDFIDTGRVSFRYRHFPFINRNSFTMALAAECARDQDRFNQFHDAFYSKTFIAAVNAAGTTHRQTIKTTASDLNLDTVKFNQCLDNRSHQQTIENDIQEAKHQNVRGTPTLFLGNYPLNWTDYPSLKKQLNYMLDRWPTVQPDNPTF